MFLSGKRALVTGSTSGIGLAAFRFFRKGTEKNMAGRRAAHSANSMPTSTF
jgi:NAD(P)-dependent dehydrogenase (short-subunit alcohol dehydrogenase family)